MANELVKLENVASVYNGTAGRCCCGCQGVHRYASKHFAWASKNRGYDVSADEISDRSVKRTVNKINAHIQDADVRDDNVSVTVGARLHVAYLVKR